MKVPNPNPTTLAEKVAAAGSTCPVPATHDRLFEIHHWWHQLARWYHEPEPFRYRLGAFIQSARSVTFMLQSECQGSPNIPQAWSLKRPHPPVRW